MVIALPPATVPPTAVLPTHAVTHTSPAPDAWTTYTVRSGDTLIGLAATFRTSPRTLAVKNGITDAKRLWAGDTIQVPAGASATGKSAPRATGRRLAAGSCPAFDFSSFSDCASHAALVNIRLSVNIR